MHTLFIVFVSFVSYAFGVVTSQRWRGRKSLGAVHPLELLSALLVVLLAVFLRMPHLLSWIPRPVYRCDVFHRLSCRRHDVSWKETRYGRHTRIRRGAQRCRESSCLEAVAQLLFRLGRAKNALQSAESGWMPRSDEFSLNSCRRPF
jgi:hypothetical protein